MRQQKQRLPDTCINNVYVIEFMTITLNSTQKVQKTRKSFPKELVESADLHKFVLNRVMTIHKYCVEYNSVALLRSRNCILDLWYLQHFNIYMEITNITCVLLSKHLFERTQNHYGFTIPLGKDKFMYKIMSSCKASMGASCINDINTWEKLFCSCYF